MKQRTISKFISGTVAIVLLIILIPGTADSQIIEIKKWNGTYPDMEGTYPLTFISFTGWLIPVPHIFVRTWPTHYYIEAISMPVSDAPEITGSTKTGFLRIAAKLLERSQMKGRQEETEQIKIHTDLQKQIEEKLFDSRSDQLADIYQLAEQFVRLYKKVDRIGTLDKGSAVENIYKREANELLLRFLMVNLMQSEHGKKLDAFSEINTSLNKLLGEADYTYSKIHFFNANKQETASYSFLTQ